MGNDSVYNLDAACCVRSGISNMLLFLKKCHLTRSKDISMNIERSTHRARLCNLCLLAATCAAIALGMSARTKAEQLVAAAVMPIPQLATPVVVEAQLFAETPASMMYHDHINVSAIAVAAYDH